MYMCALKYGNIEHCCTSTEKNLKVCTETNLVCTCIYKERQMHKFAFFQYVSDDLKHMKLEIIPLCYEDKHLGDKYGYIYTVQGHSWLVVPCGWCQTSCAGPAAPPRSCHDITGPDINLDFQEAQLGCEALLGSHQVAPDRRPTEKQAPAGELACFHALGTHKACCLASESLCQSCLENTGLTYQDWHCSKQEWRLTTSFHIVPMNLGCTCQP